MPRAYTPAERERIRERLLQAGLETFTRLGLVKTTIADLARAGGIGKGSFYQFFESKEALFLAVQEREEASFKATLLDGLERAGSGRQAVRTLFTVVTKRLVEHPFLQLLLDPETMTALTVRIAPELLSAHRKEDQAFFVGLLGDWKERGWLRPEVDPDVAFEILTAMFLLTLQRELLGEDATQRVVAEVAEALADRWCVE